ncbi:MAG: PaaI family thioesterase [Pseudomonadota bacterium]
MENLADAMPFARHLGVNVTEASKESVVGEMVVREEFCTLGKSIHGGAVMAFADSLAAIGAYLNLPEGAAGTTTIESKTNFLGRAAEGSTVTATSTPVSVGKRVSVWQTKMTNEDGKAVALVTQTQLVL